jgi:hypothetical protein
MSQIITDLSEGNLRLTRQNRDQVLIELIQMVGQISEGFRRFYGEINERVDALEKQIKSLEGNSKPEDSVN